MLSPLPGLRSEIRVRSSPCPWCLQSGSRGGRVVDVARCGFEDGAARACRSSNSRGLISRILQRFRERESERQTPDVLFGPLEKLRIVDVLVDRSWTPVACAFGRARTPRTVLVGISIRLRALPDVGRERHMTPRARLPASLSLPSACRAFRHDQTPLVGLVGGTIVDTGSRVGRGRHESHLHRWTDRDRVSTSGAADHPIGCPFSAVRASPLTHPRASCRPGLDRRREGLISGATRDCLFVNSTG